MNWILGGFKKDFLWLCLPGFIAVALGHFFISNENSLEFLLFAFVAKGFLDSGHVYTTLWRTYFSPVERPRLALYIYLPFVLFALFYSWTYFDWPLLGLVVVYVTLFHNIRQFLGISKWYQRLNSRWDRWSNYFLYANCALPVVVFHFRHLPSEGVYYAGENALFFPNFQLEAIALSIYGLHILACLGYESYALARWQEWNRALSVFTPSLIFGTSFLMTVSEAAVVFPLVVAHGASYLAINALAVGRTQSLRFKKTRFALTAVVMTALLFGSIEFAYDDANSVITAVFLTPLFCHYIFDMYLWKRSHPESSLIYVNSLH